jgi:hypothetical protein
MLNLKLMTMFARWIVDAAACKDFHKDVGAAIAYVNAHADGQ